ncbi:MAG: hypothetical protein ACOVP4_10020 [Bacteriovoracaceae bacterium]
MTHVIESYIDQHKLALKLRPILVGELFLAKKLKSAAYVFRDLLFVEIIKESQVPTKDLITRLIRDNVREVYISFEDYSDIKGQLEQALIKLTRSLSVGDPLENGTKHLKLLSLNMSGLYQDPHNDELLMLQVQSTQNLSKFLIENKKMQSHFFHNLAGENFHFTITQPLLSSVLLLSFLQAIHLFHDKEIESLFLTSYVKDLGFSIIPEMKYDQKILSPHDQCLFAQHADFSHDLLDGRIPLSKNYLNIIKYHHFLNDRMKEVISKEKVNNSNQDMVFGLEIVLVSVFDMLVAMTNPRPYRRPMSLYQSLEIIKRMIADDYPQEFKALVIFLKQFFRQ